MVSYHMFSIKSQVCLFDKSLHNGFSICLLHWLLTDKISRNVLSLSESNIHDFSSMIEESVALSVHSEKNLASLNFLLNFHSFSVCYVGAGNFDALIIAISLTNRCLWLFFVLEFTLPNKAIKRAAVFYECMADVEQNYQLCKYCSVHCLDRSLCT